MMHSLGWKDAISQLSQRQESWVMATVMGTQGSSPRNAGSKMLITKNDTFDTIGGGKFEHNVIEKARKILSSNPQTDKQEIAHFHLAANTQQCCGGAVSVLLESFRESRHQVELFGAGHIAHALIPILSSMNLNINWIDNRNDFFPNEYKKAPNIRCLHYENSVDHCRQMSASSIALVMTHEHVLDYQLISALLDRQDCYFIGLIGSKTKAMRFKRRLRSDSFTQENIDRVHCPVGLDSISGKKPIEIAISIAAQLVQITQAKDIDTTNPSVRSGSGISWNRLTRELKQQTKLLQDGVMSL